MHLFSKAIARRAERRLAAAWVARPRQHCAKPGGSGELQGCQAHDTGISRVQLQVIIIELSLYSKDRSL